KRIQTGPTLRAGALQALPSLGTVSITPVGTVKGTHEGTAVRTSAGTDRRTLIGTYIGTVGLLRATGSEGIASDPSRARRPEHDCVPRRCPSDAPDRAALQGSGPNPGRGPTTAHLWSAL